MKQKTFLCAAAFSMLVFNGCSGSQGRIDYIGAEQAKQLAVQSAGLTAADDGSLTADLGTRNGTDYYQVEFTAGGQAYRYDIDALTGAVIDSKTPSGETAESPENTAGETAPAVSAASKEPLSNPDTTGNPGATGAERLTAETAKSAALAHAGLAMEEVTFVKSELETEDGREIYDVEFYTADFKEYDYDIDAYSGEILSYDYDAENVLPSASAGSGSIITEEQAKELALAQVPGASAKDIREFETDYDDGRTEYEGKIIYNGMEYEFEIDAYSGAFRSWETEPLD